MTAESKKIKMKQQIKERGRQNGESTPKIEVLNDDLVHCNLIKKRCQTELMSFLYSYTRLEIIINTFNNC